MMVRLRIHTYSYCFNRKQNMEWGNCLCTNRIQSFSQICSKDSCLLFRILLLLLLFSLFSFYRFSYSRTHFINSKVACQWIEKKNQMIVHKRSVVFAELSTLYHLHAQLFELFSLLLITTLRFHLARTREQRRAVEWKNNIIVDGQRK